MVNGLEAARLPETIGAWFAHAARGGASPQIAFAPGRVNLIGAHLDYNEGWVQPIPLDRGTWVGVRPRADRRIGLWSREEGHLSDLTLDDLPAKAALGWAVYPVGLAWTLQKEGHDLPGFDLHVAGNLDIGAGLSSSASLLVACARALDRAFDLGLGDDEVAMLAYRAETGFVGVACGIMDPMASALALPNHALFLDCRDRSYQHVPFDRERLGLVIIDSATRRTLATSRFNERVAECQAAAAVLRRHRPAIHTLRDATLQELEEHAAEMPGQAARRARHVLREIGRVHEFKAALARHDFRRCGELVSACHRDLKELYEASTPQLDFLAETAAATDGVFGARLCGAGWGGCVVALTERGAEPGLVARIEREYPLRFGLTPRLRVLGDGA